VNQNRNMVLALVLSALVIIGWSFVSEALFPTPKPTATRVDSRAPTTPGAPAPSAQPTAAAPAAAPLKPLGAALGDSPRLKVETPTLTGSIALKGARFDDLVLDQQRTTIDATSPAVRLLSPAGAKGAYFAGFGWTGQGVAVPGPDTVWQASAPVLSPGKPVTLSWTNPTGVRFEQIVSVDDGYMFTVRQRVVNQSPNAVGLTPYGLSSRAQKSADATSWTSHVGPMSYLDGKADYDVDWETLDEDKSGITRSSNGGWLGFTDKYWLTALIPSGTVDASLRKSASGAYQADFAGKPFVVQSGQAVSTESRLFAGAKEIDALKRYENAGVPGFNRAIDWGWFRWFMIPIFDLLVWLFKLTGNFGVAIICLTLIVRALMYPIADKQFKSMAAMRKLQPKMKAIQERWKDDKPRQQQEILKLYQTEKVNPVGGCLPILLQIPVFYALYKVLMVSVEMRHQPFVGWIKDLSAPDPAHILNLFGLLPFTPPSILAIGPLAVLLGVTMWLQFKLNPQQMDPAQQQVFAIMPWLLMFIMAPFAAGLLVYWVTNNILTIAQQAYLYKRHGLHYSDTHPVKA
jgi:YidC/Oxa1 family membrane protein insertase